MPKVYKIKRRENRIARKLVIKQPKEDRLYNIEKQANYIQAMKESNLFNAEEIAAENNFLKKLILETSILEAGGELSQKRLPNQKVQIIRKIKKLKTELDFWEDAIKQQKKELIKYEQKKDKKNINLIIDFIEEIRKEQAKIKEKLIGYKELLKK